MKILYYVLVAMFLVGCKGILPEKVKIEGTINISQKDFFYKKEFNSFIKFLKKDSALVLKIGEEIYEIEIRNREVKLIPLDSSLTNIEEYLVENKQDNVFGYKCSREFLGRSFNHKIDYLDFEPLYRGGYYDAYLYIYDEKKIEQYYKFKSEDLKSIRIRYMSLYNDFILVAYNIDCNKEGCVGMIGILSVEELINKIPKDGAE